MEKPEAAGHAINIGSGRDISIAEVAAAMANALGIEDLEPEITGSFRAGDIRHCFADISLARGLLGYQPQVSLEQGMSELVGWMQGQTAVDRVDKAVAELAARGLQI